VTTGLAVGIAVGVGCAFVALAVVLITTQRANRRVRELEQQVADLSARRNGVGLDFASSLDPVSVIDRVLDSVVALPGIDAALISIGDGEPDGEERGVGAYAVGLSDEESERTLPYMRANDALRAIEVTYRYRLEDVNASSKIPHKALIVALRAEGDAIGSLAAVSRSRQTAFSPETEDALEMIARRAGQAVWNALRFAEAREHAELDSLTELHNRRLFYEFLGREIARARRYERDLSLIVFDLDDFKRINDRIGHLMGDSVLVKVAESVRAVVRATDIPCRVGGDEFAVILPEAGRDDAELLADRIALAIRGQEIEKVGALKISAGVAELRPEETAADLFKRADDALLRAKGDGKGRIVAG
jgi:diguanylate cyclase (GGDEF)-like protein